MLRLLPLRPIRSIRLTAVLSVMLAMVVLLSLVRLGVATDPVDQLNKQKLFSFGIHLLLCR